MSKTDKLLMWIALAKTVLPGVLVIAGVPSDKITPIVGAVTEAETALGPGTGQQKLAAVVRGVQQTMAASGADPSTIAATTDAIVTGLNAGIKIVNDVQQIKVDHPAVPPAPPTTPV